MKELLASYNLIIEIDMPGTRSYLSRRSPQDSVLRRKIGRRLTNKAIEVRPKTDRWYASWESDEEMMRVIGPTGLARGAEVVVHALKAFVATSAHLVAAGVALDVFVNVPCHERQKQTDH